MLQKHILSAAIAVAIIFILTSFINAQPLSKQQKLSYPVKKQQAAVIPFDSNKNTGVFFNNAYYGISQVTPTGVSEEQPGLAKSVNENNFLKYKTHLSLSAKSNFNKEFSTSFFINQKRHQ